MPDRVFNLKPSLPDFRDKLFRGSVLKRAAVETFPASFDLEPILNPPIFDQLTLGACGPSAAAEAILSLDPVYFAWNHPPSRLFCYYNARKRMGTTDYDSGVNMRDMLITLAESGICSEGLWPYDVTQLAVEPPLEAYQEAQRHHIQRWEMLQSGDLNTLKAAIMQGATKRTTPLGGIPVYDSIWLVGPDGILPMPTQNDSLAGGHAIRYIGWNDETKLIKWQNHWNHLWGDNGYGYLHYDYFTELGFDLCAIDWVQGEPGPQPSSSSSASSSSSRAT